MTINYTTLLGLAKPVTGTETGQWGDVVNDQITSMLEDAVANAATFSVTAGNVTLTTANGSTSQARMSTLIITGTPGTTRNVVAPSQAKIYQVINQSDSSVVIKGSATTGTTVAAGSSSTVVWNGSDFVELGNYVHGNFIVNGNLTVNGNTTLGDAAGDTITVNGATTFANVNPTLSAGTANGVTYLNGSKVLTSGSSLTWDGTTFAASNVSTGGSVTLSGGTANGVLYLNGSKVATSGGALTFDGTNLGVGGPFSNPQKLNVNGNVLIGGTGSASAVYIGTNSGLPYIQAYDQTAVNDQLAFYIGASTEQMRLTSTGLGIGTSSPASKLDVSGTVRATTQTAPASGVGMEMFYDTSGSIGYLISYNRSTAAYKQMNIGASLYNFGINGLTALTLDSSGNLGLGVTPSGWGSGWKALQLANGSSFVNNGATNYTGIFQNAYYNGTNNLYLASTYALKYELVNGTHAWYNSAVGTAGNTITFTQAMTLDASGNLLVGTTAKIYDGKISVSFDGNGGAGAQGISLIDTNSSLSGDYALFVNSSGNVAGRITHNGTTTVAYTTSSDYRLKENIAPMTGALAKVALLKPVTYKWKSDGSDGEGFIAHELAEVCPHAVTGDKDAVDEDGKPKYQGIDTSFLVATLTAAIKEQQALIQSLTARVSQLEKGA